MKITIITTKSPSLKSGSEVRNYYLFKSLIESSKVDEIFLHYFQLNNEHFILDKDLLEKKLVVKVHPVFNRSTLSSVASFLKGKVPYIEHLRNNQFSKEVEVDLKKSDLVLISELDGYFSVEKVLMKSRGKTILDCHNVDYLRFKAEIEFASPFKKLLAAHLSEELRKLEIDAVKKVSYILTCSDFDKVYFSKYLDQSKIQVVPNGVKIKSRHNKDNDKNYSALFMGMLSYPPNEDALRYYFNEIHEFIKSMIPSYRLTILGKNPPNWLSVLSKHDKSVELLGFVDSVDPYLEKTAVCICPLRFGSGTRLKILEYMGLSKAVVSTTAGCEGIDVEHNKNILVATNAKDFADEVVLALSDYNLRNKLGSNAFNLVNKKYNWSLITEEFVNTMEKL